MSVVTQVDALNINQLTQAQYDALVLAGTVEPDEIYMIVDGTAADDVLTGMAEAETYTAIADTDTINTAFGKVKKFFTDIATTIRATVLTGLSVATATAVEATDSILVAIGKLQAQIGTLTTLTTTDKSSVVAATNELLSVVKDNKINWRTVATAAAEEYKTISGDPITLKIGTIIAVTFMHGNTFGSTVYLWQSGWEYSYPIAGSNILNLLPMQTQLFMFSGASGGNVFYPISASKGSIGLPNVDNTSDIDKPISTAAAAAMGDLEDLDTTEKGSLVGAINENNALISTMQSEKTYVFDDFTREDGAIGLTVTGQTWVKTGNGTGFTINNNLASPGDVTMGFCCIPFQKDGVVSCKINTKPSTISGGITIRFKDADNYIRLSNNPVKEWTIGKKVAGVATSLASLGASANGDIIKIRFAGPQIKGYVNGVLKATVIVQDLLTEVNCGLFNTSGFTTNVRWENPFKCEVL